MSDWKICVYLTKLKAEKIKEQREREMREKKVRERVNKRAREMEKSEKETCIWTILRKKAFKIMQKWLVRK